MKFYLMRGNGAHDGVVAFNVDVPYFDQDYSEDIEDHVWCIKYNDEIAPAVSYIELTDTYIELNGGDSTRNLTQEEISKYAHIAERLYNEAKAAAEAEALENQRSDDMEFMTPYLTWSTRAKRSRDEMLITSDPYLLLSNLDSTGWEEWREWARNLPQQFDIPMNITSWSEPPANANAVVLNAYNKFKRNCESTKRMHNHYNP